MRLDYLIFDFTDDDSGGCSFDALASALGPRRMALLEEVKAVLAWARQFGPPSVADDGGTWAYELQASDENDAPLDIEYDVERDRVLLAATQGRLTIALTLSGSSSFGDAFRHAFLHED